MIVYPLTLRLLDFFTVFFIIDLIIYIAFKYT